MLGILNWGDLPGLLLGPSMYYKCPHEREEKENWTHGECDVEVEAETESSDTERALSETTMSQGVPAAAGSWKRQGGGLAQSLRRSVALPTP